MREEFTYKQGDLFDQQRGEELAEIGLSLAVENAERKEKDWKKLVWQYFLLWLRRKKRMKDVFMVCDFRFYLKEYDLMEMPPSERAFGFISKRATKEGWIIPAGIGKSIGDKAHGANAGKYVRA